MSSMVAPRSTPHSPSAVDRPIVDCAAFIPVDDFYGNGYLANMCARFLTHRFLCSQTPSSDWLNYRAPPTLSQFIASALYLANLPPTVAIHSIYLLWCLKCRFPNARAESGHRLFLAAFKLASAANGDIGFTVTSWFYIARGLFTRPHILQMEHELSRHLDWCFRVDPDTLTGFEGMIRERYGSAFTLDAFASPSELHPSSGPQSDYQCSVAGSIPASAVSEGSVEQAIRIETLPGLECQTQLRVARPDNDAALALQAFQRAVPQTEPVLLPQNQPPNVVRVSDIAQQIGSQVIRVTLPGLEIARSSSTSVATPEPPQIIRLESGSFSEDGSQVVRVTSPMPAVAPVPTPVQSSETPHFINADTSALQEGSQVIRVTSPSQTIVLAPALSSDPQNTRPTASASSGSPQPVCNHPPPPAVAVSATLCAVAPVVRAGALVLEDGAEATRDATSVAPSPFTAAQPAVDWTSLHTDSAHGFPVIRVTLATPPPVNGSHIE